MIRPFVYVREKDTREFAESCKLPIIPENCPACFEAPKVKKVVIAGEFFFHHNILIIIEITLGEPGMHGLVLFPKSSTRNPRYW